MSNAFDQTNYPAKEPKNLVVGDRWLWKRPDLITDYPVASYSLKYSARLESTATEIEITATGAEYFVEVSSAVTATYTPGVYYWQAYITRLSDSQRIQVANGRFTVKSNNDASTADPRSHVEKVLSAIEAVIQNRATQDQLSYSIAGRTLQRTPIQDLLLLRQRYQAELKSIQVAEDLANGITPKNKLLVRFTG